MLAALSGACPRTDCFQWGQQERSRNTFLCSPEPVYAVPLPLVAGKLGERMKELGCFQLKSREEGKENKLLV